jgi:hypothetical protein
MPKRPPRDKQAVRPGVLSTARDLISARLPALAQRARNAPEASEWHVTVMNALGPELANKVNRCSLDKGTVTVVAESSAWAARMRFALADAGPALAPLVPGFREVVVKVRPRRAAGGRG